MPDERYPLVIVPGAMASELYLADDQIWPADELTDIAKLRHLKGDALTVGEVVRVARPIPKIGLGKFDLWDSFIEEFLVKELGYVEGEDLFTFPYDWRRDIRTSGRKLRLAMRDFSKAVREKRGLDRHAKVVFYLLGHSLGSLVCRWFVDQEGGNNFVSHMMLLGPTDRGVPASFVMLSTGQPGRQIRSKPVVEFMINQVLPGLLGGMTDILRSIEPAYQSLPGSSFVFGPEGPVDIFEDSSWLQGGSDAERKQWLAFLREGKKVQEAMAHPSSVPTTYVYGLGKETPQSIHVKPREDDGYDWANARLDWGRGDGIILSRSAWPGDLEAGVEVTWVEVGHNALHHTDDVQDLLRNQTLKPPGLDEIAKPTGLSTEEIKEYLQAILDDDRYLAASRADSGQQVVPLPADPDRPTQDVRAVLASVQPGKPIVIVGRKGAGKSEALYSVMWHVARSGLEVGKGLLMPIYLDLRRYRGEDNLLQLLWASIAETGTQTFLTEQVEALLENVPSLVFFDDLDRLLERHRKAGMEILNNVLETYPKMRAVFAVESGSYDNEFPDARVHLLLSRRLETATGALPQQVGDVIVAVIGNNATNVAIGRESSAKSVEVAADAIVRTQTESGQKPEVDYKQLDELVTAARDQEWDRVESIAEAMAEKLGDKAN